MLRHSKARFFWPVLLVLFFTDCATKELAEEHLTQADGSHEVVGDVIRFSLTYNTAGAMGLSVGEHSRVFFAGAAMIGVVVLTLIYRSLPVSAKVRAIALGLLIGGAVGNLADRLLSPRGVVDFIDVGVGTHRFWTFNIGDVGITCGALLLLVCLIREEQRAPTLDS